MGRTEANDFETLCEVFFRIIQHLPNVTFLYWMTNGITLRRDFLEALNELLNNMVSCEKVSIKLLLTCHGRSFFVNKYIDDKDILLVPSTIDGERHEYRLKVRHYSITIVWPHDSTKRADKSFDPLLADSMGGSMAHSLTVYDQLSTHFSETHLFSTADLQAHKPKH